MRPKFPIVMDPMISFAVLCIASVLAVVIGVVILALAVALGAVMFMAD